MEIVPTNSAERSMNIVCLIIGLFFGSTLISTLSATMVEFRMSTREQSQKITVLRRYLNENGVGRRVARMVQRQAIDRLKDKGRLKEKDVPALSILSTSVRQELHAAICRPHLMRHPLFRLWLDLDTSWFQRFCTSAVDTQFLRLGDDLFIPSGRATACYYLISGQLNYTQEPDSAPVRAQHTVAVEPDTWLCESALWSEWLHVGKMEAVKPSQVLVVNVEGFVKALRGHRIILAIATDYCRSFHERIVVAKPPNAKWPSDLEVPFTDYGDLVASMSQEVQMTIGMHALEQVRIPLPWSAGILLAPVSRKLTGEGEEAATNDTMTRLRKEIHDGKSIVVMTREGNVERVVSVVVMHIVREQDSKVFVQVGKWEGNQVFVDCQLPALKRERDESTEEAATRLLSIKLAPLAEQTEVLHVEREVKTQESKEFGLHTTYMRKVFYARLKDDDCLAELPRCRKSQERNEYDLRDVSLRKASLQALEFLENCGRAPVHFIGYENKGVFGMFLSADEFERLKSISSDVVVQQWITSFRPPEWVSSEEDEHSHAEPSFDESEQTSENGEFRSAHV